MIESLNKPERPHYISKLLDATKNKKNKEEETYKKFLIEADKANKIINLSNDLAINCSGSILPLGVAKTLATTNKSLELIFYFYARLQDSAAQLGTEAPTFEQILWASNTLSFLELTIFCRDFSIIPTLLSKDELRFIWRVSTTHWENNSDQRSMRFCDFPDILVRMAIVAYNKPMMKALLITEFGYIPSAADLVRTLCNYIRLHDVLWVQHRIATVGRETMKSMNFRSVGEVNSHAKQDLRNEIAGKRLAKFMAKDIKNISILNNNINNKDITLKINNKQITKIASKLHLNATGLNNNEDKNISGNNSLDSTNIDNNTDKSIISKIPDFSKLSVVDRIFAETKYNMSGEINYNDLKINNKNNSNNSNIISSPKKNNKNNYLYDSDDDINDNNIKMKLDNYDHTIITPDQEKALLNIDHSLRHILDDFTQIQTSDIIESSTKNKIKANSGDDPDEDPNYIVSGSNFIDLGSIPANSKITIKITITNKGNDDMLFDVMVRDMADQQVNVKVIPTAIAPGLHRTIQLNIQPISKSNGEQCIIGYVDIYYKYKRNNNPLQCCNCPIYYKVGHYEEKFRNNKDNTGHIIPRCTTKTLERILHKFNLSSELIYY